MAALNKKKRGRKARKVNLRRTVRVRHGVWCQWQVDQIDGRTGEGKWARRIREKRIKELGREPTLDEMTAIDHLIIDELKKRLYDLGILDGKLYGSRDMGQAISESINRRLMKRMGIKKESPKITLEDYIKFKDAQKAKGQDEATN